SVFSDSTSRSWWTWLDILGVLWGLGFALSISLWIYSMWQLRNLRKKSKAAAGTELEERLVESCQPLGCKALIQLRISDDAIPSMTWGIFRHVILLPVAAIQWSRDRQHLVLAHELAHIGRRDAIGQLLAQTVCSLYWFNPLVWYAVHRLYAK